MPYGTIACDTLNASTGVLATQNGMTGICKAWVNFNGNSGASPVIRSSFNVSSVTRNGTGDYTINFTTAMSNTDYATICNANCDRNGAGYDGWFGVNATNAGSYGLKTTSAVKVCTITSGSSAIDFFDCGVTIFSS